MRALSFPVLALALAAPAPSLAAPRRLIDRLEASVNAAPILRSDIINARRLLPLRSQLDPLFAGSSLAKRGHLEAMPTGWNC